MSSKERITFTKDNIDTYLKALAKEYRRLGGRSLPAEIILIGGASVLINYGFRDMTTDIDAVIRSASTMKEAIDCVGDELDLPRGWLNEDFKRTSSFSPKLVQYSSYYKTYYGVLTVRTVSGEYLIAMKLMSGRQYKSDLSDIIGILAAHERRGAPITKEMISSAVVDLYGSWDGITETSRRFIDDAIRGGDYSRLIKEIKQEEMATKDELIEFEEKYPGRMNAENVDNIIDQLKIKKRAMNNKSE